MGIANIHGQCHLSHLVWGHASCPPRLSFPGSHYQPVRDDILHDFYVVFVDILALEAMAQNAEGPVYHSHSRTINLQLILNFQILTFKAI